MILLTVGTQLPFERLVRAVDDLAPSLGSPVFAQTGGGTYRPAHMESSLTLTPVDFDNLIRQARLLVSHAGIGSVLTAQRHRKPIILFPRRAALGEHRNDHQLATVRALEGRPGIDVAMDEEALARLLRDGRDRVPCEPFEAGRDRLRQRLTDFIADSR